MQALYTETLESFLERNSGSQAWANIVAKFDTLPKFNFGTFNLDLYDLFCNHYKNREIGSEWEDIFVHNMSIRLDTIILTYAPKVQMWLDNFQNMLDRKISTTDTGKTSNMLYPTVTNSTGRVANSVDYTGTKEQALFMMKSNADILSEAMEVRDMYYDMLRDFDKCFMEIY